MKPIALILIIGFCLPTLLTAQVKPVNKSRNLQQVKNTQIKQIENKEKATIQNDKVNLPIGSKVFSVDLLRRSVSKSDPDFNARISQFENNSVHIPNPYNSENGIVLDALNPAESFTRSNMTLHGVKYDSELINQIKSGTSTCIELSATDRQFHSILYTEFNNLPGSDHLYLLTLAMQIYECFEIKISNSSGDIVYPLDKFVYNHDLEAYQLLLMMNADLDNQMKVNIRIVNLSDGSTVWFKFYYIQLVQLD